MNVVSYDKFKYDIMEIDLMDKLLADPCAMMLIGVPGSGKSTFVDYCFNDCQFNSHMSGCALISTDYFIENWAKDLDMTYNALFKDSIKLAERMMYKTLDLAISRNRGIIWDQTNISKKVRKNKLDKIPKQYYKVAVFFETPHDLQERLAGRSGKMIPDDVMKNMINNIEFPSLDEGFDQIITIKAHNESIH